MLNSGQNKTLLHNAALVRFERKQTMLMKWIHQASVKRVISKGRQVAIWALITSTVSLTCVVLIQSNAVSMLCMLHLSTPRPPPSVCLQKVSTCYFGIQVFAQVMIHCTKYERKTSDLHTDLQTNMDWVMCFYVICSLIILIRGDQRHQEI